ncbi:hypothetical protein GLYMA_06G219200v4 [Glycine max]|uniref:26S proteasome non-ATPase regulatory subunit 9 isoform A n=1 Tax=Glycine soja TaxID=3848 RepID=A0A445KD08_GLYSO|nr:hypothetical protein GLYMA_06G219200v4 [Glycine max]RZC08706.1 26S proteasome non-ATPase regulatory subunit 9 isoform A [Glycine soja]
MVATNVKAETMSLMDKRSALEAEMNSIIARLSQPGAPGLSGNLVDSEGFPRSDIDIPVVRAERRRLAELRSDHNEVTEKINLNIQILHSARLGNRSLPFKNSGNDDGSDTQISSNMDTVASTPSQNVLLIRSPNSMDVNVLISRPFAMVDEIADASPAVEDGLQLGDQILKFGNVEAGDNLLQRLSSEAQSNLGCAVPVVIMRQGTVINLTITPRPWQGRGLLGYACCLYHFVFCCLFCL